MRVVSLLASGTEIVCGLGAGEMLVGRSHECDNPPWVTDLPLCTSPAFDISVSSRDIDAEVRRRLKSAEPLYYVDTELINNLKPDLLITQAHCDVCAVTPQDLRRAGCVVVDRVVALEAGTLRGIYRDIAAVGSALRLQRVAEDLVTRTKTQIAAVWQAVRHKCAPIVGVLEWTDPVFAMGNWGPELVEAANGQPVLSKKGDYSKTIPWQHLRDADPEYLIIAPCGFNLERTIHEVPFLETLPGWFELRAVREGRVALADGNKYFNRSGTTIGDTVEILAEIFHGYGARYQGKAWESYHERSATTIIDYLHAEACDKGRISYTDPATGYEVFTAEFLSRRGTCCNKGCRHCPYRPNANGMITSQAGLPSRSRG